MLSPFNNTSMIFIQFQIKTEFVDNVLKEIMYLDNDDNNKKWCFLKSVFNSQSEHCKETKSNK